MEKDQFSAALQVYDKSIHSQKQDLRTLETLLMWSATVLGGALYHLDKDWYPEGNLPTAQINLVDF